MKPAELFDPDAEISILRSLNSASVVSVGDARVLLDQHELKPDDFFDAAHAAVFAASVKLIQNGEPSGASQLDYLLRDNVAVQEKGGRLWLFRALEETTAFEWTYGPNARVVRGYANRRRANQIFQRYGERVCSTASDFSAVIAESTSALAAIDSARNDENLTGRDMLERVLAHIERVRTNERTPTIPTGVEQLDQVLGGLQPGVLQFIGAQPGVGKSALLATITRNVARNGTKVGLLSLEDLGEWITQRYLSDESGVPLFVLRNRQLTRAQHERVVEASPRVDSYANRIHVNERSMPTVGEVDRIARNFIVNKGCGVIVLDHLGKVDFESKKFHRPDLAIEHGLNLLTALAKTYHVPILVAAHLKAGEGASKYSTPSLNDFAQTAYIGRDARAAIGLFRDKKIADALHVAVLKQTNGISDVVFTLRTKNGSGLVENKSDEMVVDPYADTEREMMRRTQRAVYAVNPDDEATA